MSEKLKEALSAVVDGEADEFELRRVLDEMPKDPALKSSWERYHLIGAVLRGEGSAERTSLRERVFAELEGEALVEDQPFDVIESSGVDPARTFALGRWTSLAVAASVAVAVVLVFTDLAETSGTSEPVAGRGVVEQRVSPEAQQAALDQVVLNSRITTQDEERTDAYKIWHTQTRGMNQPGFRAFAKMVTYQKD